MPDDEDFDHDEPIEPDALPAPRASAPQGEPPDYTLYIEELIARMDKIIVILSERREVSQAEGLSAREAAAFCGVSVAKWHGLNADALIPAPAELGTGRCPRWVRTELRAWLLAGTPPRRTWNDQRQTAMRRVG
jgi:predicted DNA-binding transcriptional regulator AlpA